MSGTNSADRILAILDVFSESRLEWTPDELMSTLGYSRPTLYRYVRSLKETGLLASTAKGSLTLGPKVVELDFLMRKSDALLSLGKPHLFSLSESQPCSALLVRWYGSKLLCVASECSLPNPITSYPRGRPMPLARGAISRAIMAWLPRRQLEPMIAGNLPEYREIGLGDTVERVLSAIRHIRREGVAVAHGEVTPGVVGIAAPILADGGKPIAALCVTIPNALVDEAKIASIKIDVRSRANAVSIEFRGDFAIEKEATREFA